MNFLKNWVLILILTLGAILRLWNLSGIPPGLTWDEAAHGYNAYSILNSGKDEYGNFLPLTLKSFGDYKPSFYTYLAIPFIAVLGPNALSVRLPNALFGIGLVLLVYFFVKEITQNKWLSITSAFMMAISPLGIIFSRAAWESNAALFLNTLGVLFFLKGISNKRLILSALAFGLSLITYQSSRIVVPALVLGLLFIYRKNIKFSTHLKISFLILALFTAVVSYSLLALNQGQRLQAMNFFAYQRSEEQIGQISNEDGLNSNSLGFMILHGEWFAYLKGLVERYMIYFSPRMLFIDGDYSPRHSVPDLGAFYYLSSLLIPLGIIYLLKLKPKGFQIIFYWLAIGVIPGVLSRDLISMVRALNYILPMTILEGVGLYILLSKSLKLVKPLSYISLITIFLILAFNFLIFIDRYFIHSLKEYSQGWVYGYKEVYKFAETLNLSKYDRVFITDDYGQPYIYHLFYLKYPPRQFQDQAVLDQPTVDVGTVRNIDNIFFRHIYWPKDRGEKNSLFIGTLEELPDKDVKPFSEYKILKDINFLDGQHAFRIVESK